VVLSDASGLQRTYTVPSNWTGDRMLAQPGHGTLDLATLAPQPGFASVATAAEDAGFDAEAVLRIDVVLVGSGAIDDVVWCAPGSAQVHASATVRNGTGVNPLALSNPATPVLGGTWAARLDCSGHSGGGYAHLLVHRQPGAAFTAFGELLVGGPSLLHLARPHLGSAVPFTASIPRDLSLLGLTASGAGSVHGWRRGPDERARSRAGLLIAVKRDPAACAADVARRRALVPLARERHESRVGRRVGGTRCRAAVAP
jgi:hypothetical protein